MARLGRTGDHLLHARQMGGKRFTPRMNALAGAFELPLSGFLRFGQKCGLALYLRLFHRGLAFHQLELPVAQLLARSPKMLDPQQSFSFKNRK